MSGRAGMARKVEQLLAIRDKLSLLAEAAPSEARNRQAGLDMLLVVFWLSVGTVFDPIAAEFCRLYEQLLLTEERRDR